MTDVHRDVLASTAPHLAAVIAHTQRDGRLPSIVAGAIRDGRIVWHGTRGAAVRQGDAVRPDRDTQYRIGSLSKTFTAVLVMQLAEAGRLGLGDRLDAHIGDTPFDDATLRGLLAHSAGLPAEPRGPWWERSAGVDYERLTTANRDAGPVLPSGEQYHYSNLAYAYLGRVVEKHLQLSWWDAVRVRLLDPLGMRRTTYHPAAPHADGFSTEALTGMLTREPHQDTGAMAPAGQLWSTIDDLAAWSSVLLGREPELLSPAAARRLRTPQSASPDEGLSGAYGLGLRLRGDEGRVLVGHSGSMPGFLAGLFADPVTGVGGVVLANGGYGLDVEAVPARLVSLLLEHEPWQPDEWTPTADVPAAHRELLGTWHWGNSPSVLSTNGTELHLTAGSRSARFEQVETDVFRGLSGYHTGETMRVVRRDDGSISHLDVGTFCYTRIPYDSSVPIPGAGDS